MYWKKEMSCLRLSLHNGKRWRPFYYLWTIYRVTDLYKLFHQCVKHFKVVLIFLTWLLWSDSLLYWIWMSDFLLCPRFDSFFYRQWLSTAILFYSRDTIWIFPLKAASYCLGMRHESYWFLIQLPCDIISFNVVFYNNMQTMNTLYSNEMSFIKYN